MRELLRQEVANEGAELKNSKNFDIIIVPK